MTEIYISELSFRMVLSPLRRLLPPILFDTFTGAGKKRKLEDTQSIEDNLHMKCPDDIGILTTHEDR